MAPGAMQNDFGFGFIKKNLQGVALCYARSK